MFSFAGPIPKEVKKVVKKFVTQGGYKRKDIFFDDWSIPPCAEFTACCKVGVLCSQKLVFISSDFLDPNRRFSTLLEWDMLRHRDAKSVQIVL